MLRTARWVTGSFWRDLVLFALLWLWMLQLLLPFGEATSIPAIATFVYFVGGLFLVDLLIGHFFGRLALKLILVAVIIYHDYYSLYQYPMYDPHWLWHWLVDLYFAVRVAFDSHMELLQEAAKTTGFLLALWMMQSFFRQSLRSRWWMVVFLILGATGIAVMDTFFVKDATWQAILYVLIGLVILAFMQLPVIERVARMPARMKAWPSEWLVWTLVLSLLVVGTSWAAPKSQQPTWPDPVAYLQGKVQGPGTHQKIGYGNDDAHLGGPFQMDDTPVFTVLTTVEGYYRGETKTVYTGKGWLSTQIGEPVPNLQDITALQKTDGTNLETKKVTQKYTFERNMPPVVFSQFRMTGVQDVQANANDVRYSDLDSRLDLPELKAGQSYTVVSQIPYFDEDKLKQATRPDSSTMRNYGDYLYLPKTLPQRVRDLAQQITKDAKTPYEQADALETYLRSHYEYNTTDVPVPGPEQDFVDQFLFESKRGYCDHFSSAMVVMARTLGLPSRWVKGFTKGTPDLTYRSDNKDEYKYVVKNRNAHSWPEIYFNGIGWVAFEPTATFPTMPHLIKQTTTPVVPVPTPSAPNKHKDQNLPSDDGTTTTHSYVIDWKAIGLFALYLLVASLVVAFFFRRRLLTAFYLRRAYQGDGDVVVNALVRLLRVMERFGWRRREDMTLREYALHLAGSHELRGREMIPLAQLFERVRYGQKQVDERDRGQLRDLWMRIVRKAGRQKKRK